jgi:hypothetical protein
LNPRLRPWQGRTLPLSYSRSATVIINDGLRRGKPSEVTFATTSSFVWKGIGQPGGCFFGVSGRRNSGAGRGVFVVPGPLRVQFGGDDLAIAHVDNLVPVLGSFRVVSDHEYGLAEFAVRLA